MLSGFVSEMAYHTEWAFIQLPWLFVTRKFVLTVILSEVFSMHIADTRCLPLIISDHVGGSVVLTHWGRVTYICIGKSSIIGSDNGLSPGWCQAIIWTNAGILLIEPLGTNFSAISIRIQIFSFKKMHLKMASVKWCPFVSASMC